MQYTPISTAVQGTLDWPVQLGQGPSSTSRCSAIQADGVESRVNRNVTKPNGVFAGAFFEAFGKAVCVNIAFVLYFYYLMFLARGD